MELEYLSQTNYDRVQYYLRRGNQFYFRTPKKEVFKILVSDKLLEHMKKELTFGKEYILKAE